ncbi:very short patch repair endonuclease [uncultured Bacteroides sp.]|uniref:very short patch repair endonuclease n=1 Tax=uncultured Bacteroides sp. TaxID=162156 RepID=UPI0026251F9E|nr:very short patch repair endonuclease [uncultured Bacteroides sp.]
MSDTLTNEQRHHCMSQIRSKNTKPEVLVRKELFRRGYRYRINVSKLPGKPDIVLPKYKTVIFVNGCFWHGHEGCKHFVLPKSNVEYWQAKIRSNQRRDKNAIIMLQQIGWNVITIWECNLTVPLFLETIDKIETAITLQSHNKRQTFVEA